MQKPRHINLTVNLSISMNVSCMSGSDCDSVASELRQIVQGGTECAVSTLSETLVCLLSSVYLMV